MNLSRTAAACSPQSLPRFLLDCPDVDGMFASELRAKEDIKNAKVIATRATAAVSQTTEIRLAALHFLRKQDSPRAALAEAHRPGIAAALPDGDGGLEIADEEIEWRANGEGGAMVRLPGALVAVTAAACIVQADDDGAVFQVAATARASLARSSTPSRIARRAGAL